jgi:hypothetical protein
VANKVQGSKAVKAKMGYGSPSDEIPASRPKTI